MTFPLTVSTVYVALLIAAVTICLVSIIDRYVKRRARKARHERTLNRVRNWR